MSFLCILGYFLKVNVQSGDIFFRVAKTSNIFEVLDIPDILLW